MGAWIIRIGFLGILYSYYNKEPPQKNSIGDYKGPYRRGSGYNAGCNLLNDHIDLSRSWVTLAFARGQSPTHHTSRFGRRFLISFLPRPGSLKTHAGPKPGQEKEHHQKGTEGYCCLRPWRKLQGLRGFPRHR